MLRAPGVSNADNANLFFQWLKSRGITSHRQAIVQAVAEKVRKSLISYFFAAFLICAALNFNI